MIALLFVCFQIACVVSCRTDVYLWDSYNAKISTFTWERPLDWKSSEIQFYVTHLQDGDELFIIYMLGNTRKDILCLNNCTISFDNDMVDDKHILIYSISTYAHDIDMRVKDVCCEEVISRSEIIVIIFACGFILLGVGMLLCCGIEVRKNEETLVPLNGSVD